MQTKIHINIQQGMIEIEGEQTFVEKIHQKYQDILIEKLSKVSVPPESATGGEANDSASQTGGKKPSPKKKAKGGKKGGPSCADRILDLKKEGFMKPLRAANDIRAELGKGGHHYKSNQIAAALNSLIKRKELRRINEDG